MPVGAKTYSIRLLAIVGSSGGVPLLVVSRSQTFLSIAQHGRGKGLGVFPGDDVSLPLGLGEVINVNRRFDLRELRP